MLVIGIVMLFSTSAFAKDSHGDNVKDEHDKQRARQLHVGLGHLFVIHLVGGAERAARGGGAQFFGREKAGQFHRFILAGRAPGHGIDRRGRRSF